MSSGSNFPGLRNMDTDFLCTLSHLVIFPRSEHFDHPLRGSILPRHLVQILLVVWIPFLRVERCFRRTVEQLFSMRRGSIR